jgi:alpha-1,3-fucosyltransferase
MFFRSLGNCGRPCPKTFDNGTEAGCKLIIAHKYKFFFAFENSICQDYITEKLFDILPYDIIPVVYGYGPYERWVPKSGYINAFDYPEPIVLAKYLLYLDSNKTAYNEYFKWKRFVRYDRDSIISMVPICEMCIRLNIDEQYGFQTSPINDMNKFWSMKTNCKRVVRKGTSFSLSEY